ncbi:SbcC/MukB-like Walker B domain-containing protein [Meiothermus cerbereus]|uniref:SbcC/MukB-like Walker B domain-containing protein n=1 Tax=Meiothermus cerbereus TaxID=65552 RepID=UPI0004853CB6|nr:SMC family ATPase [Meiothermus cerbereus]
MRPIKLLLDGFGPYAQAQTVDFNPDLGLFAITGPTGAGKSTLLDAITYALYKATPRIGATGLKDLKHPQADAARVELTFAVGEQLWRVVRVVGKENQNRLEFHQNDAWRIHPASEKVRELDAKLAEILGMDYDTFTRAILLPQGQFDLFLRGSPKERRETLIKLYGLETLKAMRERVMGRLEDLKKQKARLEGELAALAEAEEERLGALRDEIAALDQSERALTQKLQEAERTLKKLEELVGLWGELESWRRRQQTWENERPRIAEVAARLARAQQAERIWPQVEAIQQAEAELQQKQQALGQDQSKLEKLEAKFGDLRARYQSEKHQALEQQMHQLPLLRSKEASLKRYGGSLGLRHPHPLPFDEDRLDQLRDAERVFAELEKARIGAQRAQARLQEAEQELQQAQTLSAELKQNLAALADTGKQHKARLEEAKQALEREKLQQGLGLYHAHLKQGEPCPLCGHPVENLPPPKPQADLQALEAQVEHLETTLGELRAQYAATQQRLKDLEERLPRLQEQLDKLRAEAEEARKAHAELEAQAQALGSPEQVREERTRRLAALAEEVRTITGGKEVAAYVKWLEQELQTLRDLKQEIDRLEAQVAELKGKIQSQAEVVRVLNLARQRESLLALLRAANFDSLEAARSARLSPEEMEALQKRIKEDELEGAQIASNLGALEEKLRGQPPITPDQVTEQRSLKDSLERELDAIKKSLGGKRSDLKRLEEQLKRKRQLLQEKAELDKQIDLWEQLAGDLKGDRFQDFLLERYQSGLLGRASQLIASLSQNRYSLQLEDGEYFVFDRWTDALRPVRTLSGGESFMASLCLALSLSEHLSRGRIGALFLDEGFGTLDGETLEQVAGVLEALPTQGRLVGIVTHVEALAERLPARLEVYKSPAGSQVRWRD